MKELREAFDRVYAERKKCFKAKGYLDLTILNSNQYKETLENLLLPGATIVYSHGQHSIEAEVIRVCQFDRVLVRSFKSGREYTLHPARIEHISVMRRNRRIKYGNRTNG